MENLENTINAEAAVAVEAPVKRRRVNQQRLQDNIWGWTFCAPLIVGTTFFVYIAFVIAVLLSLSNYREGALWEFLGNFEFIKQLTGQNMLGTDPETGLAIYEKYTITGAFAWYKYMWVNLVQRDEILDSLFNTVFYMVGIPAGMALSVFFAVCMSRDIKGANFFRVVYYIPCVASTVAITYTFQKLFGKGDTSIINRLLFGDDTSKYIKWIEGAQIDPVGKPWASGALIYKLVVVIMGTWKGLGGTIILYIAGLSGVNASHKEAASIDGANGWITFWKIEIPQLWPTIFYNMVTAVIGGMQIYTEPDLLFNVTGGFNYTVTPYVGKLYYHGPMTSGSTVNVAYSCALGIILAIIIFIMTLVQFALDKRDD